jgi:hypothetical protein
MHKKMFFLIFLVLPAAAFAAERPTVSVEKLIAAMDEAERSYYFQAFDYSMEVLKPDEKYEWKSYNSSGYIQTGQPFVRNDTVCRNFREYVSNKNMYSMSSEGVGCKRLGRAGWCKLKKDEMRTCALEAPQGPVDDAQNVIDEAARRLDRTQVKGKSWWNTLWPY